MNRLLLKNIPDRECLVQLSERYPELDPDIAEVYLNFLKFSSDVGTKISEYLSGYGLSTGRMSILMMLNGDPDSPVTPGELADRCGVTPATISGLIDGLIRDGHVERILDPGNRRVQPVMLTKSGRDYMKELLPGYFNKVKSLFSPLSSKERTVLLATIKKLQSNLN